MPNGVGPDSNAQVMLMNVDGTGLKAVGPAGSYLSVDLSHDGTQAALIEHNPELGGTLLFVASVASGTALNITPLDTAPQMPEFSPDGSKIYFVNTKPSPWEIWSVDPDGSNATSLGDDGATCMHEVTVGPNGKLYFHGHAETVSGLYSMDAGGGNVQLLIEDSAYHPSVTADGTKLVFELSGDGSYIAAANIDGSNVVTLSPTGNDEDPIVVGDKILFISNPEGNPEVYSMNLDGTNRTRLTNNTATDWFGELWD
jgi:TolB protein